MAIIDGKRIPGVEFYVTRTDQLEPNEGVEYVAVLDGCLYGICCFLERGESPLKAQFRYCSAQLQNAFIDHSCMWRDADRGRYRPVSWNKMPEDWRTIFRRDLEF